MRAPRPQHPFARLECEHFNQEEDPPGIACSRSFFLAKILNPVGDRGRRLGKDSTGLARIGAERSEAPPATPKAAQILKHDDAEGGANPQT